MVDFPESFRCNRSAVCRMNEDTFEFDMVKDTLPELMLFTGIFLGLLLTGVEDLISSVEIDPVFIVGESFDGGGEQLMSPFDTLVVITVTSVGSDLDELVVVVILVLVTVITFVEVCIRSIGGFGGGPFGLRGGSGGGLECWFRRRGGFSIGTHCADSQLLPLQLWDEWNSFEEMIG